MENEIIIKEVEVQKLNLQPGEVLIVTVKNDDIDYEAMESLAKGLTKVFKDNKVVVMCVGTNGEAKFTVVKQFEVDYNNKEESKVLETVGEFHD